MDLSQEIALKANLLQDGLRIESSALEGVGTRYKESENWQFTWELGEVKREQTPAELKLPLGTWVQVRPNEESHYLVRLEGDALILENRGKFLTNRAVGGATEILLPKDFRRGGNVEDWTVEGR